MATLPAPPPTVSTFEALLPLDHRAGTSDWYRAAREELASHRLLLLPSRPWQRLVDGLVSAYEELLCAPIRRWNADETFHQPPDKLDAAKFLSLHRVRNGDAPVMDCRQRGESLLTFAARTVTEHRAEGMSVEEVHFPGDRAAAKITVTCACGERFGHRRHERHRRLELFRSGAMLVSCDALTDMSRGALTALRAVVDTHLPIDVLDELTRRSDEFRVEVGNAHLT